MTGDEVYLLADECRRLATTAGLKCPHARRTNAPCVFRDGAGAVSDNPPPPACVGCGHGVEELHQALSSLDAGPVTVHRTERWRQNPPKEV